jgi:hypothetical protein
MSGSLKDLFKIWRCRIGVASLLLSMACACSDRSPASLPAPAPPLPLEERSMEKGPLPAEPYDPSAQIEQLKELRDKGLLTDAEFQEKKQRLLERR